MKRYHITLDERTFDVRVLSDPHRAEVQVEVDGEVFTVGVETVRAAGGTTAMEPSSATTPAPAPAAERPSARTVTSPLPGVIKSIAVRSGQQVAVNDELVVIEAMKMDNVLRAQQAGTIGVIYVTEGRQVAHGEPLLDYED